mgnify:CR=1 FL=1
MSSESINNTSQHRLNNTWVVWYHNPSDNNWDIKSYENVYEINNLMDYCKFQNSRHHLPSLTESMFFIMRKVNEYEYIYPMWEDVNNKSGGCWSFKISSNSVEQVWDILSNYLIGENIGNNFNNSMKINGISFSPKKGFSIVKIWNNDANDTEILNLLNLELGDYLNLKESLYKSHVENISKDQKKKERFLQKKKIYTQKNWNKKNSYWKKNKY